MRIDVRGKGLEIGASLRGYVERRVAFALGRRSDQLERVQVWLEDVNGPRGGADKRCRVKLTGRGLGAKVIEASGSELGAVVHEALERAAQVAGRALERAHEHRLGSTRPGALALQG